MRNRDTISMYKTIPLLVLVYFSVLTIRSYVTATEGINYDKGLHTVQKYIKSREFQKAEDLLKEMLMQYPDNAELLSILARILYWEKKYDESIEVYKMLLKVKPSEKVREDMDKVFTSKELGEIDELIKKKNLQEAKERLRVMYGSGRAKHGAGYRLGMLHLRQRKYEEAFQIFTELRSLYPEDKGFEELYIESMILLGEIEKAKETLYSLPAKRKESIYKSRDDLFYRVRKNSLMIKTEFYNYTKGIEDEKKYTLQLFQRIMERTFVVHYSNIYRFGTTNNQVGLDVYSKLGEKTKRWSYIYFTASPDADFLPEWTAGGAIYQGYRNLDFSLGYAHMEFENSSVDRLIPGIIVYLPHGFAVNERLFINLRRGTVTLLSKLHFEPNHKFNGYYSYAFGKSAEEVGALQDIEKINQSSHGLGFEYRFRASLSIGGEFYFQHRELSYEKEGISIFTRYYW